MTRAVSTSFICHILILFMGTTSHAQTSLYVGRGSAWPAASTTQPANSALQSTQTQPIVKRATAAQNSSGSSSGNQGAQTIASFLQALTGSGAPGSPGYGRSTSASGLSSASGSVPVTGSMDLRDCGDKQADVTALNTMIECSNRKLSAASNTIGALVDVDQKVMFIVDRSSKAVVGCVNISTGKSTGDGTGQTPVGMMITRSHSGPKYQSNANGTSSDCIGLQGTDPETIKRAANGVVIHKAHGRAGRPSTLGCIGIDDAKFDKINELLYGSDSNPKRSAIYIHDKNSREKCDGGSTSGDGGGNDNSGVER